MATSNPLLRAFAPAEVYARRSLSNVQWHVLRGEAGVVPSSEADVPGEPSAISGRTLNPSSFEIGELLGEGNYSMVYQATLKSTQEPFALKVVDKSKVQRHKKQQQ